MLPNNCTYVDWKGYKMCIKVHSYEYKSIGTAIGKALYWPKITLS